MYHFRFLTECVHIVRIGKNGVKALYASSSCGYYHLLSGSVKLYPGKGYVGLKIFCIVSARKSDTYKPGAGAAYIVCVYNAEARFQSRHKQGTALQTTKFNFCLKNIFFDSMHIFCGGTFRYTNYIRAASHTNADVFFPVRCIQPVYADYPLGISIIYGFQGMVQRKTGRVFLVF